MEIVIIIKSGVVQEVRGSNGQAIKVKILDLDDISENSEDPDASELAEKRAEKEYPYVLL